MNLKCISDTKHCLWVPTLIFEPSQNCEQTYYIISLLLLSLTIRAVDLSRWTPVGASAQFIFLSAQTLYLYF